MDNNPPRTQDRMPGRYWGLCWWGRHEHASRWRRRVDDRTVRRYAATIVRDEAAADNADNEPDCRHGCNGDCVANGIHSDRCSFTCHPHLRACPRCGRVMERHDFHDHESRDCSGYWQCSRCGCTESFTLVCRE